MTGHGAATIQAEGRVVSVEVRSVNGRHFKLTLRTGDRLLSLESLVEAEIRQAIRRGTVYAQVTIEREARSEDYRIEKAAFLSYYRQVEKCLATLGSDAPMPINAILELPGVVDERSIAVEDELHDWPVVQQALSEALDKLQQMRRTEGEAMAQDMTRNLDLVRDELDRVAKLAPDVVVQYRQRLEQRLSVLLADQPLESLDSELAREVAIFADRCDISEEIVRLRSHLDQFGKQLAADESQGKKLEFLLQEMNRETNTIGSKANASEVAQAVVEIKSALERMREMVQNVE